MMYFLRKINSVIIDSASYGLLSNGSQQYCHDQNKMKEIDKKKAQLIAMVFYTVLTAASVLESEQ